MKETCLVNIGDVMLSHLLAVLGHACGALGRHNESVYLAVLAAESHFIVGHGAVVIDTVSLVEYLCM